MAAAAVSGVLVAAWLRRAEASVRDRREWLTELDAAIGDGDHGINLARGMAAVVQELHQDVEPEATRLRADQRALNGQAAGALLNGAGRTILATVGGASGALYGRAFVRAGLRLAELEIEDSVAAIHATLRAATAAVAALGRAVAGEKTMLDALIPAVEVLRLRAASSSAASPDLPAVVEAVAAAADAAEEGALATIPMLATKGRASYLGDRSIGHLDPGAASSALLIRALADTIREHAKR